MEWGQLFQQGFMQINAANHIKEREEQCLSDLPNSLDYRTFSTKLHQNIYITILGYISYIDYVN